MIRVAARELCWQARILSSFPRCRGSESKEHGPPVFDEFVKRLSTADAPNLLWVADITEHPTSRATLYCSVMTDVHSNRIISYWECGRFD